MAAGTVLAMSMFSALKAVFIDNVGGNIFYKPVLAMCSLMVVYQEGFHLSAVYSSVLRSKEILSLKE